MTNITASELKMLYIQVVMIAIIGVFLFLYNQSPIDQTATFTGATPGSAVSSSDIPWGTKLVDATLGLPFGLSAILIVSSIILIPMTIMNTLTLVRLAKDFLTQWV